MNFETQKFSVRIADWSRDAAAIHGVRHTVFVVEQHVDPEEEWDEADPRCLHVLAETQKCDAVGTGRLDISGKIGRMAVLAPYRGNGVGSLILNKLVDQAKHKSLDEVYLNAQVRAMAFYALHGFEPEGDEFLEANIPHVRMRRRLEK